MLMVSGDKDPMATSKKDKKELKERLRQESIPKYMRFTDSFKQKDNAQKKEENLNNTQKPSRYMNQVTQRMASLPPGEEIN